MEILLIIFALLSAPAAIGISVLAILSMPALVSIIARCWGRQ